MKKNAGGKKAVITGTLKSGSKKQLKYTIQCMKGAVKSIQITGKKTVKPGKTLTLKAAVKTTKGKANKTLKWKSGNTKLARVTVSGTAVKVKTYKGKKGTVKITAAATDGTSRKKSVKIKIK